MRLIFQVKWAKVPQSSHRERDDDDDDDRVTRKLTHYLYFLALLDYTLDGFDDDAIESNRCYSMCIE